jgi:ParB family chromosome partitioning protein
VQRPSSAEAAIRYVKSEGFLQSDPARQFSNLLFELKQKPARKGSVQKLAWQSNDSNAAAEIGVKGRSVNISLLSRQGNGFGVWLSENLDDLYQTYKRSKNTQNGD